MADQLPRPIKRVAAARALPHLTPDERVDLGRRAREAAPRSSHATFDRPADRPDPIDLLERQALTRVPELVPIRYGRMLVSPFTFFRGAALVMASDLALTPRSGLTAQVCGDAHLCNFGVFASPERTMMFDVNDFDETLPGPWEWDVKRLAASVEIAGRDRNFTKKERSTALLGIGAAYRTEMQRLAGSTNLEVWYSKVDIDAIRRELEQQAWTAGTKVEKKLATNTVKALTKARTRDSMQALEKLTTVVDGRRRIISDPPLIVPAEELLPELEAGEVIEWLRRLIRSYRRSLQTDRRHLLEQFQVVQLARKVVGVGSVGTRAWIVLLTGRDGDDPLFLQAKEAEASVLEEFVGKSTYHNHAERVVAGQHLMQAASDIFLGWQQTKGVDGVTRDYYVRQLRDWKGSIDPEHMLPEGLARYAEICAGSLARAHARSGDRIAIASYLGTGATFDRAIAEFSATYADQNERDYDQFGRAVKDGRITAETGL